MAEDGYDVPPEAAERMLDLHRAYLEAPPPDAISRKPDAIAPEEDGLEPDPDGLEPEPAAELPFEEADRPG
jgi:hypothetical protein